MNQDQLPPSDETTPLIVQPLTPQEREHNQAIVEKVLDEVMGQDSEPGE